MPLIEVQGIHKTFYSDWGKVEALSEVNFSCLPGQFITIVGPSGCGKTTLLRIMAGLETPSAGQVFFEKEPVSGPGHNRAIIFQEPRLFPWLTVEKNIVFAIQNLKTRAEAGRIVNDTLSLVGLDAFRKAYPYELSGGMAQRVALARALAFEPKALLMDEPFSALDVQNRSRLQLEFLDLWRKTQKTVILVTHDIEEALILSQKIMVMSGSPGTVKEIVDVPFSYPRDPDELDFINLKKYILRTIKE